MDDLPEEHFETYPPPWSDYEWSDYDQDDFDDYIRTAWLPARLKINK